MWWYTYWFPNFARDCPMTIHLQIGFNPVCCFQEKAFIHLNIVSFNKCTKLKPFIPFSIGLYVKNCNMSSWPSWIFDSCEKKINCEGHLMTIQLGLNHVYCFQQKSFYSSSHRILFYKLWQWTSCCCNRHKISKF